MNTTYFRVYYRPEEPYDRPKGPYRRVRDEDQVVASEAYHHVRVGCTPTTGYASQGVNRTST